MLNIVTDYIAKFVSIALFVIKAFFYNFSLTFGVNDLKFVHNSIDILFKYLSRYFFANL